jgi:hypothetical protein
LLTFSVYSAVGSALFYGLSQAGTLTGVVIDMVMFGLWPTTRRRRQTRHRPAIPPQP